MKRSVNQISMFYIILLVVFATLSIMGRATMEADEKDCADQLANLASCLPFVSGTGPKPTPQCCEDTKKVKTAKPKCLCVLIKESTDPSLGLPINTTLALQMPSACNIDAKVSDCPALLNLAPDSADAKIFTGGDSSATHNSPTSASTTAAPGSSSTSTPTTGSESKTNTIKSSTGAITISQNHLLLLMVSALIIALSS